MSIENWLKDHETVARTDPKTAIGLHQRTEQAATPSIGRRKQSR